MARKKLPSFQFYPGDWLKDPNLRRCSKAAKGAWIDMLCLMFECDTRGVLSSGGQPWGDEDIAAAIGGDAAEVITCIRELLSKGVASRNDAGAIFSRRLVRDEQQRNETRQRVSKHRATCNGNVTHHVTPLKRRCTEDEDEVEKEDAIEVANGKQERISKQRTGALCAEINQVVEKYLEYHPRSKPGARERKKIAERLREGYSVPDLCAAIDGNHRSAFHSGDNDRCMRYHAFTLIMRDADHVREFIEYTDQKAPVAPRGRRNNGRTNYKLGPGQVYQPGAKLRDPDIGTF